MTAWTGLTLDEHEAFLWVELCSRVDRGTNKKYEYFEDIPWFYFEYYKFQAKGWVITLFAAMPR